MSTVWRVLFAAALAATVYLTLAPLVAPPPLRSGDKVAHLAMFAVDGWLGLRGFGGPRLRMAVCIGLVLLGCLLELLQGWVPYRQPSIADALANTAGVAIAALATRLRT